MMRLSVCVSFAAAVLLCLSGCLPPAETVDEEKEAYYLSGSARHASHDYEGAVEQFERALQANPRSAAAHWELGILHAERLKNYAAAIYHFEKHLKLRPDSPYVDRILPRIQFCKRELARTELLEPVTLGMQRDIERLTAENTLLKRQIESLQTQLSTRSAAVPPTRVESPAPPPIQRTPTVTAPAVSTPPPPTPRPAPAPAPTRVHTVSAGETITGIARQYGVRLDALMAANPGVSPTRLQIGQRINVPTP